MSAAIISAAIYYHVIDALQPNSFWILELSPFKKGTSASLNREGFIFTRFFSPEYSPSDCHAKSLKPAI